MQDVTGGGRGAIRSSLAVAAVLWIVGGPWSGVSAQSEAPAEADPVARGAYVMRAAGCFACHTDLKNAGPPLAGGRALKTPFGTFFTPNITPDREHGIGTWTDSDFIRALRAGVAPDGGHYFPAFPYTSYVGMTDRDILDLKAYLFAQPPVAQANRPHDIDFPFGFRPLLGAWKALYFNKAAVPEPSRQDEAWNRGAYLVEHLGHCGECHTPRNMLGGLDRDRSMAGNPRGPDGDKVPNITPHPEDGLGDWSASDLTWFLKTGFFPDGDFAGGAMTDVVEHSTGHLTDADRAAMAAYLRALPPLVGP